MERLLVSVMDHVGNSSLISLDDSNGSNFHRLQNGHDNLTSDDDQPLPLTGSSTKSKSIDQLRARKAAQALYQAKKITANASQVPNISSLDRRKSYRPSFTARSATIDSTGSSSRLRTNPVQVADRPVSVATQRFRERKGLSESLQSLKSSSIEDNMQKRIARLSTLPGGVGVVQSPNTKSVKSKIGSLDNARHTPGGGKIKEITSNKINVGGVTSKVGSLDNAKYKPAKPMIQIESKKPDLSNVKSRCGSLSNKEHTPGGGNVKIQSHKQDFSNVTSKYSHGGNVHTPKASSVKIMPSKKLDLSNVKSKCGSLHNASHRPGGGDVKKIVSNKINLSQTKSKVASLANATHKPRKSEVKIFNQKPDFTNVHSKDGRISKSNATHKPRKSEVKIFHQKPDFTKVPSKTGAISKTNAKHVPSPAKVQIFNEKLDFKSKVTSKIGSLTNAKYTPGGGDVIIFDENNMQPIKFNGNGDSEIHTSPVNSLNVQ